MRVFDDNGNSEYIVAEELKLDSISTPARLSAPYHATNTGRFNSIEIDLVAGYVDTALDGPDGLRRALLLLVSHAFEFRGAIGVGQQPAQEPQGFRTLIAPYRKLRL